MRPMVRKFFVGLLNLVVTAVCEIIIDSKYIRKARQLKRKREIYQ